MISVSVYTNKEAEEESNRVAADFAKQHMARAAIRLPLGSRQVTSLQWPERIK